LSFSRDAEREADRVGLQMLRDGGFDASGMVAFFGRMQNATRVYNEGPAFLRSHPLTSERIADIQERIRDQHYRQRADSLGFHLVRARMRILQDESSQGLRETANIFSNELEQRNRNQSIAAKYGLAVIAFKQRQFTKAQALLQEARALMPPGGKPDAILASFAIDLKLAMQQPAEAVRDAASARAQFPLSRGIAVQYADALIAAGRNEEAARYLRDQTQLYRQDARLQDRLAKVYSAMGRQALQHMALAESYALSGSLPSALEQLNLARRASDASFYDQAQIDARERELQVRYKEEIKESRGAGG
jgi:predicted Zn-dependent protease